MEIITKLMSEAIECTHHIFAIMIQDSFLRIVDLEEEIKGLLEEYYTNNLEYPISLQWNVLY